VLCKKCGQFADPQKVEKGRLSISKKVGKLSGGWSFRGLQGADGKKGGWVKEEKKRGGNGIGIIQDRETVVQGDEE